MSTFTDQSVKSATTGDHRIPDCQALLLRVTANGAKSFRMVYRSKITGKVETKTLGQYPDVTLAVAKAWVHAARERNANNQPVGEFTTAKKNEPTVDEMLAKYDATVLARKRSRVQIFVSLRSFVANNKWGDLPFTTLTKRQIMAALEAMPAKMYANQVQHRMSTWLKWGVIHDHLPANPIAGMPPVGGEAEPRERTLSETEIRKLWAACHDPHAYDMPRACADVLLTILTTACRPGMACGMVEDELFGFADRPAAWKRGVGAVQDLPRARMKMGVPFVLPLNPPALEIIERRRALAVNGVLFPTPSRKPKDKNKPMPVRLMSKITKKLSARLGFKVHFTPHDLRRTASDLLCREFNAMTEVNAFLAHETTKGVMRHYNPQNRWNSIENNRKLATRLGEMLQEIISKPVKSGGEVVEIRRVA